MTVPLAAAVGTPVGLMRAALIYAVENAMGKLHNAGCECNSLVKAETVRRCVCDVLQASVNKHATRDNYQ